MAPRQEIQLRTSQYNLDNVLDSIGIIHNEALDYIFNQVKENSYFTPENTQTVDSAYLLGTITGLTSDYLNDRLSHISANYTTENTSSILSNALTGTIDVENFSLEYNDAVQYLYNLRESSSSANNYEVLAMAYMNTTMQNLAADEALVFKASTLVSISSMHYWENNLSNWEDEIEAQKGGDDDDTSDSNGEDGEGANPGLGKEIAESDIEGVVGGAITGGVGGAVAGGIGAVPGAILGGVWGGVVGSAVGGVGYFIW